MLDEHSPSARARVERLLAHFNRFLAPDDHRIHLLNERLATLQPDRVPNLRDAHPVKALTELRYEPGVDLFSRVCSLTCGVREAAPEEPGATSPLIKAPTGEG